MSQINGTAPTTQIGPTIKEVLPPVLGLAFLAFVASVTPHDLPWFAAYLALLALVGALAEPLHSVVTRVFSWLPAQRRALVGAALLLATGVAIAEWKSPVAATLWIHLFASVNSTLLRQQSPWQQRLFHTTLEAGSRYVPLVVTQLGLLSENSAWLCIVASGAVLAAATPAGWKTGPETQPIPASGEGVRRFASALGPGALALFLHYDLLLADRVLGTQAPTYIIVAIVARVFYLATTSAAIGFLARRPKSTSETRGPEDLLRLWGKGLAIGVLCSPWLAAAAVPGLQLVLPTELVPSVETLTAAIFGQFAFVLSYLFLLVHRGSGNASAVVAPVAMVLASATTLSLGRYDLFSFVLVGALFSWLAALTLALFPARTTAPESIPFLAPPNGAIKPISAGWIVPPNFAEWVNTVWVCVFVVPWLQVGEITFADLAFGTSSKHYLEYMLGVFNEQLGTPNWFNLPRLWFVGPAWLFSSLFHFDGNTFLAALLALILLASVWSTGLLVRLFAKSPPGWANELAIGSAAFLYTFNPWVTTRIQHIYLLCGYALVPAILALGLYAWGRSAHLGTYRLLPGRRDLQIALLIGVATSASFGGIHFGFWGLFLLGFVGAGSAAYALPDAIRQGHFVRWFLWFSSRATLAGAAFGVFAAFWAAPFVQSIVAGVRPSQHNVNTTETVVVLSRYSTWEYVPLGTSYWWPMFNIGQLPESFWIGGWVVITVIAIGALRLRNLPLAAATVGLWALATGTTYAALAPTYLSLVFKTGYPLGDMLRDPNKIYGAALLPMAILFGEGVRHLAQGPRFIRTLVPVAALFAWNIPHYSIFMLGYYAPIEWPVAYQQLRSRLEKLPKNSKVLYLPVPDHVVSGGRAAAPDFNRVEIQGAIQEKPTSDHVVFDTPRQTVFPYEGNDPTVAYFLRMVEDGLLRGDTEELVWLAHWMGITHVVHRNDHSSHRERLEHERAVLDHQPGLHRIWSTDSIVLYEVEAPAVDATTVRSLIYTPGGLNRPTRFYRFFQDDLRTAGIAFADHPRARPLETLRPGDAVELSSLDELLLASLPPDRLAFPSDTVERANPQYGWAKMAITGNEWPEYLRPFGVENASYDLDRAHSIAVTHAPVRLNAPAYQTLDGEGPELLGKVLEKGPEFLIRPTDSPLEVVEVRPAERGIAVELRPKDGKPHPEWMFFESEAIPIRERSYYRLNAFAADDQACALQARFGFYDKEGRRLGTEFVEPSLLFPWSTEREGANTFAPPPTSRWAKLEFRASCPEWTETDHIRFREIRLHDLGEYDAPNTLSVPLRSPVPPEAGVLWVRSWCSTNLADLAVSWNGNTQTRSRIPCKPARFVWDSFPTAEAVSEVQLEGRGGVNAVHSVVWLSDAERKQRVDAISQQLGALRSFALLDGSDATSTGAVTSPSSTPGWVDGNATFGPKAQLNFQLDIPDAAPYELAVIHELHPGDGYEIVVVDGDGTERLQQTVTRPNAPVDASFSPRATFPWDFGPGTFTVSLRLQGAVPPTFGWEDLGDEFRQTTPEKQAVRRPLSRGQTGWGSLMTTPKPVLGDGPLMGWFRYHAVGCNEFHAKVFFYGPKGDTLDIRYITGIDQRGEAGEFQFVEQPPVGTASVSMQFLAKPGILEAGESFFEVSEFQLWSSSQSPAIDALGLVEATSTETNPPSVTTVGSIGRGYREISIDSSTPERVVLLESGLAFWNVEENKLPLDTYPVHGVALAADLTHAPSTVRAEIRLNRTWSGGIALAVLGLVGLALLMKRR